METIREAPKEDQMKFKKGYKIKIITNEGFKCNLRVLIFDNNFIHIRKTFFTRLNVNMNVKRHLNGVNFAEEILNIKESTLFTLCKTIWSA